MKKNLGNFLLWSVIFVHVGLYASTYKWNMTTPKKEVYTNEAIYIKYICEFSDRGELYTVVMQPTYDAKKYTLTLIKKQDSFVDGKRRSSYEYLAKAKFAGELELEFNANMRKSSIESIVYSSGSRDDDRGNEAFEEKFLSLASPKVYVRKADAAVVGAFSIEVKKDKTQVQAYEPYHLDVEISGIGNINDIQAIDYKIEGVKVFTQKPSINSQLSKEGESGTWHQKFAFVGEKDFTIPAINIQYFNPQTKKIQNLAIASSEIKVTQSYKKEELLDAVKEDTTLSFFKNKLELFYYLLTFIAGFLLAKINFKTKKKNPKDVTFITKVKAASSLDALSVLLILENERKYSKILLEINQTLSLAKAKKEVLKTINRKTE